MHDFKQKEHIGSPAPEIRKKLESQITTGLKSLSADELVDIAKIMGKYLKDIGLKTTQIRKFLDSIRKIESQSDKGRKFNPDSVILLKPKLAYAAGRDRDNTIKPLMEILEPAISAGAKGYDDFKRLVALIEGIVAYHKYYGGQD
jgi:CRISPR-associated protein Csm2